MSDGAPIQLTVVIPTYNRASIVGRAVRSVLAQEGVTLEVIVVDDGSSDETEHVISGLDDSRVRYIRTGHGGAGAARNVGASHAKGTWLGFLDSDDEVLPGWAEALVLAANRAGRASVCGGEAVDSAGRVLWTWVPAPPHDPQPREDAEMFLAGTFVVDRGLFVEGGGYAETLTYGENTELALRLLLHPRTPVAVEPRTLMRRYAPKKASSYGPGQIDSAKYVLTRHPWMRREFPRLWASYNALLGVEAARQRRWRDARRHLLAAALAKPSREHLGRAVLSQFPPLAARVWQPRTPPREAQLGPDTAP